MTNAEFSNEFDVLYNNITSNLAPGLDEYEKSVFLTKALDLIVKDYFNPKSNKVQDGFDDTPRRQIDFSMILRTLRYTSNLAVLQPSIGPPYAPGINPPNTEIPNDFEAPHFDNRAETKSAELKDRILMFINESVTVSRNEKATRLTVVPLSYLDYDRLMSKPFSRPLKKQAWRLIVSTEGKSYAELIVGAGDTILEYNVRYIRRPKPIVLGNLDGLTIDGEDGTGVTPEDTSCELDPILHLEILQRAVELAQAAYAGDLSSSLALGVNSQTDIGMVSGGGRQS